MEFRDLAESRTGMGVEAEKAPTKWYPSLRLNVKQLPELKDKKIDETLMVLVEATVKGIHKYENGDIEFDLELKQAVITEDEPKEIKEKLED